MPHETSHIILHNHFVYLTKLDRNANSISSKFLVIIIIIIIRFVKRQNVKRLPWR